MRTGPKKLCEQVIVLTGASSGIGLVTARLAAQRGARLVLAARSDAALGQLTDEIRAQGGDCINVTADVADPEAVRGIARTAQATYGGFDTWINNAGVSIYGPLLNVPIEDMRRLFDTNFWGVVYGSLEAARHLREHGGVIINVGSSVSDRAIPLQGIYSASKHAVKGFTDALRMELEHEGAPVRVSLIKPAAIDTPYTANAMNYLETAPSNPPPVYVPQTVARAVLRCAEKPVRDVFVGGGAKWLSVMGKFAPRLMDKFMETFFFKQQKSGRRPRARAENALYKGSERLLERGDYMGHVSRSSVYTQATLHPYVTGATLAGAGVAAALLWRALREEENTDGLAGRWSAWCARD